MADDNRHHDEIMADIDYKAADRNGPRVINLPDWWNPLESKTLDMVLVDRHERLWRFNDEERTLTMFEDTNAASF